MRTLGGHRGAVRAVAFLTDGRLVSAGQDGRVLLHGPGEPPKVLHKSQRPVYAVAVRPDGGRLAFGGRQITRDTSNPIGQLDVATGQPGVTLSCTVVDPIWIYPIPVPPPGSPLPTPEPVPRSVWALSWSADGRFLAAAVRKPGGANIPDGGGGRCWDFTTGKSVSLPEDVYDLCFAPTGHELAVFRKNAVEGYTTLGFTEPAWRLPTTAAWGSLDFLAPGQPVVAAGGFLYFHERPRVKSGLRALTAVAASADGRTVLVGGGPPGGLEVYDADSGERRVALDFGLGVVHAVAVAPDGLTAAAGGEKGLAVFDL